MVNYRLEMQQERERQKEQQVEELKRSMQSGMVCLFDKLRISCYYFISVMCSIFLASILCDSLILSCDAQAQAMKEQAQLKEEMAYQYKIGNFEVMIMFI